MRNLFVKEGRRVSARFRSSTYSSCNSFFQRRVRFVFILRIKSIGELIFLCFAFLFYHSRACLHDIGWRHVHRFYYLRCFYYLCWFYYNRSIVTARNYVYATKPIFFRKKCSSVDHLSQERRKLLTSGFF